MALTLDEARRQSIVDLLDRLGPAVYSSRQLQPLFREHRSRLGIPDAWSYSNFEAYLRQRAGLQELVLNSPHYGAVRRLLWRNPSDASIALSVRPKCYFTHGTAIHLHGLSDAVPKTWYVNREQTPKPAPSSPPRQESIDRAFSNRQRVSRYVFAWSRGQVVVLSGKHTGRLAVEEQFGEHGERLPVSSLERTLIDAVVRPSYSGGIHQVAEAYRRARDRVSVARLLRILKKLDYAYPYHQSIGFLLERAGMLEKDLRSLRKLGLDFDFYLAHQMREPVFDAGWRVHHPRDL